jgi:hypothetical protein
MKEPIAVEARFERDGTLRPLSFDWKGRRYLVESQGRQWEEKDVQHFLVMVGEDQVFELAYFPSENQWKLIRSPHDLRRQHIV